MKSQKHGEGTLQWPDGRKYEASSLGAKFPHMLLKRGNVVTSMSIKHLYNVGFYDTAHIVQFI